MHAKNAVLYLLVGLVLITILHTVGLIASRQFGFKNSWLNVLLFAIYIFIAYSICKRYGFDTALFINALLATFEATIGLRLPYIFKIDHQPDAAPAKPINVKSIIFMIGIAGIFTALGYLFANI